jgi:hypothetical protein
MKTSHKIIAVAGLLSGLALAAQAQTVIGSWQSAPIPPTPAYDEGWQRGQGGFGPNGSIFASSNCPSAFDLYANVAAGYSRSLVVHEYGYGNVRLFKDLSSQVAAVTNNSSLHFTFSVPPGDANTASGYIQLVQFQYNTSLSGGLKTISGSWAANGFSETGDTNNNQAGQPVFYYYATAPARQQVVTWHYGNILSNFVGASYIQLVWIFQTSGGELTNIFINNVTLSGQATPTIIVDQFNPTNNPYAGSNIYAAPDDEITNVYNLFSGYGGNTAVDPTNIIWDATQNCTNTPNADPNSGALKLIANFTGNNQFLVWNRGPGNAFALNPAITNGLGLLTFEFDVKYDPSSPTVVNGGVTNYGHLEWGVVPPYSGAVVGSVEVAATNAGWTHVTIPLNAAANSDLMNVTGFMFKQYAGYFGGINGQSTLWLDNLKFTYTNVPPVVAPPTMAIQKPAPGLRLFTGGSDIYGRSELITASGADSQTWVSATPQSPVSYSFTVKNIPANMGQTHLFLIPESSIPDTSYNGQDYNASNGLWLTIGSSGVARVAWKTNWPGHNAYDQHVALLMTNTPAVGTWTLSFTSATSGSLAGPGGSPMSFTLSNATMAADFADPLAAYFGCQPNGSAAVGGYEDWAWISTSNTANAFSEDFTTEPTRDLNPRWRTVYGGQDLGAAVIVSTNDMPGWWVNWTLPAANYAIGTGTNLTSGIWINPTYYSGYTDIAPPFGAPSQFGTKMWVLVPRDDLPTVDGSPFGMPSPIGFFLVGTNVVSP